MHPGVGPPVDPLVGLWRGPMERLKHPEAVAGVTGWSFLNLLRSSGRWQGRAAGARSERWVCTLAVMEPGMDEIKRLTDSAPGPRRAANGAAMIAESGRLEAAPPQHFSPPSSLPPKKTSAPLCLCGESAPPGAAP